VARRTAHGHPEQRPPAGQLIPSHYAIGWRGRSEDDLQSFVVIEHDLRLCLHIDPQTDDEALECLVGDLAGGIREVSSMIWPDETGCACQR
jgi:hypothetical protein